MYSKQSQLSKVKKDNPKKMTEAEQKAFRIYIGLSTRHICQLCNKAMIQDYHHPIFGCRGADKDDRCQAGCCRDCHEKCHKDKHGFNLKAVEIGNENYQRWIKG
ncbi:MAG: hypothetical protein RBR50_01070 [Candidatus Izemoplasmatales bacterium]|nr:hypothetical protein [Candidatus Izemoplasmatales bacterium]